MEWWRERLQLLREAAEDWLGGGWALKIAGTVLAGYLLVVLVLGVYWSREPALMALPESEVQAPRGALMLDVGAGVAATLLDKPGGYLSNDILPPGVWLDNMPSWEQGVLAQVRLFANVLRDDFGRPGEEEPDPDLVRVATRFHFSATSWAVPSTESQYREALHYLRRFSERLTEGQGEEAQWVIDPQALDAWLMEIEHNLADHSRQLAASVGPALPAERGQADPSAERIPRWQVDNVFYRARGTTWALWHLLGAAKRDLAPLLQSEQAEDAMWEVLANLERAQQPVRSPVILNGRGFGMLANHSLVMASYISAARAAVTELRDSLKE